MVPLRRGEELILIVEDNPKNLKVVRDTLQVKRYRTIEVGTSEEGVQLAREQQPALVLMDIQLTGISGIEAFRQLRADPITRPIPIIAVTASVTARPAPVGRARSPAASTRRARIASAR
jgi:CheY-like chemotaxis protein